MSERFSEHPSENPFEMSEEQQDELNKVIEAWAVGRRESLTEVTDKEIDEILARYIESGQELEPEVKESLRRAIARLLGMKIS